MLWNVLNVTQWKQITLVIWTVINNSYISFSIVLLHPDLIIWALQTYPNKNIDNNALLFYKNFKKIHLSETKMFFIECKTFNKNNVLSVNFIFYLLLNWVYPSVKFEIPMFGVLQTANISVSFIRNFIVLNVRLWICYFWYVNYNLLYKLNFRQWLYNWKHFR